MGTSNQSRHTFQAGFARVVEHGFDFAIALLFWFLVILIVILATVSGKSPWDTGIAAAAALSQGVFAYMVWRQNKVQFAFTQRIAERQTRIDLFDLRQKASGRLDDYGDLILPDIEIGQAAVEAFEWSYKEIRTLFPENVENLSFELYQAVDSLRRAHQMARTSTSEQAQTELTEWRNETFDIYTELQNAVAEEMRVR